MTASHPWWRNTRSAFSVQYFLTILPLLALVAGVWTFAHQKIAANPKAPNSARLAFISNEGQLDSAVAFHAPTPSGTVFVTRSGKIVYDFPNEKSGRWTLTESFIGGEAHPVAGNQAAARANYFVGAN